MEAVESQHFENLNQPTLEKQDLGFDPQHSNTTSLSPSLQNPHDNQQSVDEDEIAVKIIGEELRNLVLRQAFYEERSKGENGTDEIENESVDENSENVYGDDYCEDGYYNRSENDNGNEVGWKEGVFNANWNRPSNYPLRPDAADCAYYIKTGMCKYGLSCKFNHPTRRRYQQGPKEKGKQREESEERAGQIECKYYLTAGGCKYGTACKFNHSRGRGAISPVLELNFLGLPIRPGEKDCPYYMRTGSCKYGSNCRFHHPDPTSVAGRDPSSGYNNRGSVSVQSASYPNVSSWSPRALNEAAPFVPMVYPASQGISPPSAQWNGFKAPFYPTSEKSLSTPPASSMKGPATKTNFYPRPQQPWLVEEYPERPGQPDCSYFIKTGDCKYKFNCKFNHPKTQISKTNSSVLNDKGLPLRPDQAVCSFYSRYGICKFGPACKFDHPEHYEPSVSSTVSVSDEPRFGNSATTNGSGMVRRGNGSGSLVPLSA